jgi:hypothetical protein
MLIEENKLTHWIENFYGYGSWQSRLWFVGYEETGGEVPEEVAEKINYFHSAHAPAFVGDLCDIRELYRHVAIRWDGPKANTFANRYEYRFGTNAVKHGVWKNLIAFAHGYESKALPDILEYQRNDFALPATKREAWIPLYPLPSPHGHSWYYSWLDLPPLAFLKSRDKYEEHVYEKRITTILSKIIEYHPAVVLMYGMNSINALKKSISNFFPGTKFTQVKAIKQKIPQYHRVTINDTKLLITTQIPALRHGRVETGFDWEEFGRSVSRLSDSDNHLQ